MLTRWIKCLILGLITLSNFSAGQALAAEKKNVCAMTINSNDEIELFKKHLSPEQFNFIELTETVDEKADANGNENNAWLKASCKKGIICDVLVISGHFGGNFFGESGINLPLETLETASCDSACSGILHKPKEVFLFGCNTLAGKEQDSRTPEQYAAVLQQDGFTIEQAQQIAAFRYSPIGSSFNDRMSRIFSKVPRIYGFSSIAPSGKNIAPHLRGYLKDTAPTYFEQLTAMTSESNAALKGRLKGQPFVQTKGANEPQSPVCFIRDDKTSTISKLKYTLQVLEKGGALELAPYLSQYFEKLDQKKLNPAGFSPTLTVRTRNLRDQIEIRIRDNGNGIPPQIRDRIFTPFFTTKPAGQGTGLGLSISYDIIVQQHHGQIRVESEEGRFAEFVILLPRDA
ncbi:MAG: hypothetical protein HUU57_01120 [Bdellovibrio sp.]|nr:hypothetical protein [Bdellovibrio sp.]